MTRIFGVLGALALAVGAMAQIVPAPDDRQASKIPTVTGTLEGSRTAVFETPNDSCNQNDIPDSMARAFRDYTGRVHLVAASSEMFQNIGLTLESVRHSCDPAFVSAGDPDPAAYNDQVWLSSFYTFDGRTVAALSHTEYHGWQHPGECSTPNIIQCEYDSDTYHLSRDGGYHFESFEAPKNFVAGVPYKYEIDKGPTGYSIDTDIIHFHGWYYAVATAWTWPPNCFGRTGPNRCLITGGAPIRTKDVFDPSSWRGWNGADFFLTFVDPYLGPDSHPQEHVYAAVPYMPYIYAINIYRHADLVIAALWDVYDNNLGPEGLYFSTTTDLVHWTKPTLVVTLPDLLASDPEGSYYAYFSLLDPAAPDRNFTIVGDHPYLYYVRLTSYNNSDRTLFRQPIRVNLNQ